MDVNVPPSIADWPEMLPAVRGCWWVEENDDDDGDDEDEDDDATKQSTWMTVGSVGIHKAIREEVEKLKNEAVEPDQPDYQRRLREAATDEYIEDQRNLALKKYVCPQCNEPVC